MISAPIVAAKFIPPSPNSAEYVYTLLGIPSMPMRCIGKKVRFIPMNTNQKCSLPSRSSNSRPNTFGHQ